MGRTHLESQKQYLKIKDSQHQTILYCRQNGICTWCKVAKVSYGFVRCEPCRIKCRKYTEKHYKANKAKVNIAHRGYQRKYVAKCGEVIYTPRPIEQPSQLLLF